MLMRDREQKISTKYLNAQVASKGTCDKLLDVVQI
jgi:hypothetical protein